MVQHAFDSAQRRQRIVAQTRQFVADRRSSRQTIARPRTATSHQAIANIQDCLTHLARPTMRIALRRMRAILQPVGSFLLIAVPPFVKPFSTVFQSLTDPTRRSTCLFPADRFLSQYKFVRHRSTSRKTSSVFRRIVSAISWRLSFPSVSNHLAVST